LILVATTLIAIGVFLDGVTRRRRLNL
jgi:hypothetical protein